MAPRWLPLLLFCLIAAGCGRSTPTGPDAPRDSSATEPTVSASPTAQAIFDLTNEERRRAGLPVLRANARLMEAARLQAEQMAQLQQIDHVLPDARYPAPPDRLAAAGYRWQAYGENLAAGQRTAAIAVSDWMDSSGHRANIVHTSFTELGTAFTRDANGRAYYVQVFGRPM